MATARARIADWMTQSPAYAKDLVAHLMEQCRASKHGLNPDMFPRLKTVRDSRFDRLYEGVKDFLQDHPEAEPVAEDWIKNRNKPPERTPVRRDDNNEAPARAAVMPHTWAMERALHEAFGSEVARYMMGDPESGRPTRRAHSGSGAHTMEIPESRVHVRVLADVPLHKAFSSDEKELSVRLQEAEIKQRGTLDRLLRDLSVRIEASMERGSGAQTRLTVHDASGLIACREIADLERRMERTLAWARGSAKRRMEIEEWLTVNQL